MRTALLVIGLCLLAAYKSVHCQSIGYEDTEITVGSVEAASFDVIRQKRTPFFFLKSDVFFEKIRQLAAFPWWKTKNVEYRDSRPQTIIPSYSTVKPTESTTSASIFRPVDSLIGFEIKKTQRGNSIRIEKQWITPRTTTSTEAPFDSNRPPLYVSVDSEDNSESVNEGEKLVEEPTEETTTQQFEVQAEKIFEANFSSTTDDASTPSPSNDQEESNSRLGTTERPDELSSSGQIDGSLQGSTYPNQNFASENQEESILQDVALRGQWQSMQQKNTPPSLETVTEQGMQAHPPQSPFLPLELEGSSGLVLAQPSQAVTPESIEQSPQGLHYPSYSQGSAEQGLSQSQEGQKFPSDLHKSPDQGQDLNQQDQVPQSLNFSPGSEGMSEQVQSQQLKEIDFSPNYQRFQDQPPKGQNIPSGFQGLQIQGQPLQNQNFPPGFQGSADQGRDPNQQPLKFSPGFLGSKDLYEGTQTQNYSPASQESQVPGEIFPTKFQGSLESSQSFYGQNQASGLQGIGQGKEQIQQAMGSSQGFQVAPGPNQGQNAQWQNIPPGFSGQGQTSLQQGFSAGFQGIQGQDLQSLNFPSEFQKSSEQGQSQPPKGPNIPSGLQGLQIQGQSPQGQNFPSGFQGSANRGRDPNQQPLKFSPGFLGSKGPYEATQTQNYSPASQESQVPGEIFPTRFQGSLESSQSFYGQNQASGLQGIGQGKEQIQQAMGSSQGFQVASGPNQGQNAQWQNIPPGFSGQGQTPLQQGFSAGFQGIQGQDLQSLNFPSEFQKSSEQGQSQPPKGPNIPLGLQGLQIQGQSPQGQNFSPSFQGSVDGGRNPNQQWLNFSPGFSGSKGQYEATQTQNYPPGRQESQSPGPMLPPIFQGSQSQTPYEQNQELNFQGLSGPAGSQSPQGQSRSPGLQWSLEQQSQLQQSQSHSLPPSQELLVEDQQPQRLDFKPSFQRTFIQDKSQPPQDLNIQQSPQKIQGLFREGQSSIQGVQWPPEQNLNSEKLLGEAQGYNYDPSKPDQLPSNDRGLFQQPGPSESSLASDAKNENSGPSADTDIVELTGPASDEYNAPSSQSQLQSVRANQTEREVNNVDKSISLDTIARVSGPGDESGFAGDIRRATGGSANIFGGKFAETSVPATSDSTPGDQLQPQKGRKRSGNTPLTALEQINKANQARGRFGLRSYTPATRID